MIYLIIIRFLVTMYRSSAGITEGFSMCGGDFVEVYSDSSQVGKRSYLLIFFFFNWKYYVSSSKRLKKCSGSITYMSALCFVDSSC